MYKLVLFVFSSYFSLAYASSSLLEREENSCPPLHQLVLNQKQFDDKLNICGSSTELVISGPFINKLPLLLKHTELAGLNFSLSSGLNDEILQEICLSLPNLMVLNLEGMEVTKEGLKVIEKLTKLRVLNIKNTFIEGLESIPSNLTVITK